MSHPLLNSFYLGRREYTTTQTRMQHEVDLSVGTAAVAASTAICRSCMDAALWANLLLISREERGGGRPPLGSFSGASAYAILHIICICTHPAGGHCRCRCSSDVLLTSLLLLLLLLPHPPGWIAHSWVQT